MIVNPKDAAYARYGGRGITMDPEWMDDFRAFYRDMGPRPNGRTLDRIDNNGPYSKANCRWALPNVQGGNKSSSRMITFQGETECIAEWERRLGFKPGAIKRRLLLGWSETKALTTALYKGRERKH